MEMEKIVHSLFEKISITKSPFVHEFDLTGLQFGMEELYILCQNNPEGLNYAGAKMAWLVDPVEKKVTYLYAIRPGDSASVRSCRFRFGCTAWVQP